MSENYVTPQSDPPIEKIVLGAILHGEGMQALLELTSRDFLDLKHGIIFQVCHDHLEADKPLEGPAIGASQRSQPRVSGTRLAAWAWREDCRSTWARCSVRTGNRLLGQRWCRRQARS